MWKWNLVLKFDEKSSLQSNPSAEPQTVQKIRRELGSLLNLFNNRASWQLYVNTRWWELPNPKPNQVWIMLVGLQAPGMVPNCFRVTDWQMFFSWKEGTANNAKKKKKFGNVMRRLPASRWSFPCITDGAHIIERIEKSKLNNILSRDMRAM